MAAGERAGWGRGARRSESTRAGGGSEPGPSPGAARSRAAQPEPAARDMAKAGRAGEGGRAPGGQGRWLEGGTRSAPGGAAGPGEPLAQVGGGSGRAAVGGVEAGPPARAERVPRAPRPSCAHSHLVGHRVPLAVAPLERARAVAPLASQVVGALTALWRPWADPGTETEGAVPRLPLHPTPPSQDVPPGPATCSIQDATIPGPQVSEAMEISSWQGGSSTPHPLVTVLPPPPIGTRRGRASGSEV